MYTCYVVEELEEAFENQIIENKVNFFLFPFFFRSRKKCLFIEYYVFIFLFFEKECLGLSFGIDKDEYICQLEIDLAKLKAASRLNKELGK